jgi:hypothetical protein
MKKIVFSTIIVLFFATMAAQAYVQIGDGELSTSIPPYDVWNYAWSSQIYSSEALGEAKNITGLAVYSLGSGSLPQQSVYLKNLTSSSFGSANYEDPENNDYQLVYDGDLSLENGWNFLEFASEFNYNGADNLILHWENRSGNTSYINFYSTEVTSGLAVIKSSGSDDYFPTGPGWLSPYPNGLPNIRFYYTSAGPATPTEPIPANNADFVSVNSQLSWQLDDNALTYDLYWGESANDLEIIASGQTAQAGINTYELNFQLNAQTQYYWQIVANGETESSSGPIWNFTTETIITEYPYLESFETDFLPDGWNMSDDNWQQFGENSAYDGEFCAKVFYDHSEASYLNTPKFNVPEDAIVSFWWLDHDYLPSNKIAGHDSTFFQLSTDDGNSWQNLAVLSAADDMQEYENFSYSLADLSGQTLLFRWKDVTDGDFSNARGTLVDYFYVGTETGNGSFTTPILESKLYSNYPNPFNPTTRINYQLSPSATTACLTIYNIKGQVVNIFDYEQLRNSTSVVWDGKDKTGKTMPSGVYLYRLETDRITVSNKMILIK